MAECYNLACPYCVDYKCKRTATCDMRLDGEYDKGYSDGYAQANADKLLCKDCKYYDAIEDANMPGYRECHYFSSWATAHYMLPEDYCSCAKPKEAENNE